MTDDLAARRRAKAIGRVDRDCAETIAELEAVAAADRIAELILASKRNHPSRRQVFDQEADGS